MALGIRNESNSMSYNSRSRKDFTGHQFRNSPFQMRKQRLKKGNQFASDCNVISKRARTKLYCVRNFAHGVPQGYSAHFIGQGKKAPRNSESMTELSQGPEHQP